MLLRRDENTEFYVGAFFPSSSVCTNWILCCKWCTFSQRTKQIMMMMMTTTLVWNMEMIFVFTFFIFLFFPLPYLASRQRMLLVLLCVGEKTPNKTFAGKNYFFSVRISIFCAKIGIELPQYLEQTRLCIFQMAEDIDFALNIYRNSISLIKLSIVVFFCFSFYLHKGLSELRKIKCCNCYIAIFFPKKTKWQI